MIVTEELEWEEKTQINLIQTRLSPLGIELEHSVLIKPTLDVPEVIKETGKLVVLKDTLILLVDNSTLKQAQSTLEIP